MKLIAIRPFHVEQPSVELLHLGVRPKIKDVFVHTTDYFMMIIALLRVCVARNTVRD